MTGLRRLMGDRLSGGMLAVLAGYFLLLQAFVAAFTCGLTVPVEAGPRFVLCQPSQSAGTPAAGLRDGDAASFLHECPCAVCQATDVDLTVALAPGADLGAAHALLDHAPPAPAGKTDAPVDPSRLGLAPDPRGPPQLSA